jgi:hypothetical protein
MTATGPMLTPKGTPPGIADRPRDVVPSSGLPAGTRRAFSLDDDDAPPLPASGGSKWIWILTGAAAAFLVLGGVVVLVLNTDLAKARPTEMAHSDDSNDKRNALEENKKEGNDEGQKDSGNGKGDAKKVSPATIGDNPLDTAVKKLEPKKLANPDGRIRGPEDSEEALREQLEALKAKLAEQETKYKKTEDALKVAQEEKTNLKKEQDRVTEEKKALDEELKALKTKTVEARVGPTIKLSKSDKEMEDKLAGAATDVVLVPKEKSVTDLKKFLEHHKLDYRYNPNQVGDYREWVLRIEPERPTVSTHYFTIGVRNNAASKELVITVKPFKTASTEISDRHKFIEYLTQFRLVIVERNNRRFTVCDFEAVD